MEETSSNSNSSMRSEDDESKDNINEAFGSYLDHLTFSYEFMVNDLFGVLKVTVDNLKDLAQGAHSI